MDNYIYNVFVLTNRVEDYIYPFVHVTLTRDSDNNRRKHFNRIQAHKFNNYTPAHGNTKTVVRESRHRRTPRIKTSDKGRTKT